MIRTTPQIEPRFARIAAAIADPTRARMLSVLLGGASVPAGEIARTVGVNASTASEHLGRLVDEGLIAVDVRGRHRYFRVDNADVARALEALSLVAERSDAAGKWQHGPYRRLKYARTCYRHLAGELGVRLLQSLLGRGALVAGENGYELTAKGDDWLSGIAIALPPRSSGPYAYARLDRSERRDHPGGRPAPPPPQHSPPRRWPR